jgi:ABC-type phosphate transport system auxiliary subunit
VRRKTVKAVQLTGQHAAYALQMLIEDGKIAGRDVVQALKRREKTVRELRARLTALGEDVSKSVVRAANGSARIQKARKQISKAQRTARQAQGRYMAAVRQLSKDARKKVKVIRAKSGVDAAIREARRLAG